MKTFAISSTEALAGSDFWKLIFSVDISIVNTPIPLFKIVFNGVSFPYSFFRNLNLYTLNNY